jgi:hypothetical protein
MKKNIAISILGALLFISLIANFFLLEVFVEGSYALDSQPRLIEDTKVLSTSLNQEITAEELIQQVRNRTENIKIEQFQNKKSQWDWDGPIYPKAVRAGNLTYYFNSEEKLVRIDHWLANNSPLYEKSR